MVLLLCGAEHGAFAGLTALEQVRLVNAAAVITMLATAAQYALFDYVRTGVADEGGLPIMLDFALLAIREPARILDVTAF